MNKKTAKKSNNIFSIVFLRIHSHMHVSVKIMRFIICLHYKIMFAMNNITILEKKRYADARVNVPTKFLEDNKIK